MMTPFLRGAAVLAVTGALGGCEEPPPQLVTKTPMTTPRPGLSKVTDTSVDKIDLLLMIDNSRSMADKQLILGATVPDLVSGLVNPKCLDATGAPSPQQPLGPLDSCPDPATRRAFHPILDIHVGLVSSSLGGHGSDACPAVEFSSCTGGATNTSNDDLGHLLTRIDPCGGGSVPSYAGKGFLAWDPTGVDSPPGEKSLGSIVIDPTTGAVTTGTPGLVPHLEDLVLGAGQVGCGYESSIESWYRFLVDPEPYQSLVLDANGSAVAQGVDGVVLQQRKDFLRPSSLLAIIGLTDENDCSIKEYGQFYLAAQQRDPSDPSKNYHLPGPRSECAINPNDKCCRSCGQDQTGCPVDPGCAAALDAKTDDVNLRCWDQKRRFGIDFLYPLDRYVTGLTQPAVPNRAGDLLPNPIFTDLDPTDDDANVRDPSQVFLAYIVGVPWQDLARNPLDPKSGFKSASELAEPDAQGHTSWDYILGDPGNRVAPLDPHMIESTTPRTGTNPLTGEALSPPAMVGGGPDKINGHEYTPGTQNGVQIAPDDLQYACIFDLPQPRDCSDPAIVSCDCLDPLNDNPLCDDNGAKGRTLQRRAKGYPGVRELSLVQQLGTQGIAGSICPAQLADLTQPDFGYRPAIGAIVDRLGLSIDAQCLPRRLTPDTHGQVDCVMLEGRHTGKNLAPLACDALCSSLPGRVPVSPAHASLLSLAEGDPSTKLGDLDCFCELAQLGGAPSTGCQSITSGLAACQCDLAQAPVLDGKSVDGWCYVDADTQPPTGNPEIVRDCPANERRNIRFVGSGSPASGATVFVGCAP